jgi:FkbM family methyltransferase
MNLAHRLFRRFFGYTLQKKIHNELPRTWTRAEPGPFYQFPRSNQISGFSQIVEGVFGTDFDGVFLEIGAYDGFEFSNSWGLLDRHWRGFLVEPVREYFELARLNTSRFESAHVFNLALSNTSGSSTVYKFGPYSALEKESIQAIRDSNWFNEKWQIAEEEVEVMEASIFVRDVIGCKLDLLLIDVEGHEFPILENLFQNEIRPSALVVEINTTYHDSFELQELILRSGYSRIYRDAINAIYLQ